MRPRQFFDILPRITGVAAPWSSGMYGFIVNLSLIRGSYIWADISLNRRPLLPSVTTYDRQATLSSSVGPVSGVYGSAGARTVTQNIHAATTTAADLSAFALIPYETATGAVNKFGVRNIGNSSNSLMLRTGDGTSAGFNASYQDSVPAVVATPPYSTDLVASRAYFVGGRRINGVGADCFVENEGLVGQASNANALQFAPQGVQQGASTAAAGPIFGAAWLRALSDSEFTLLFNDPLRLFRLRQKFFPVYAPAAAAGGFLAAWASQRSRVIGAGGVV